MTALLCINTRTREEEHSLTRGGIGSLESCVDIAMDTILMTSVVCSRDHEDDTSSSMHTGSTSSSSSTTTSCSSTSKYEQQEEEDEASFDTIFIAVEDENEPSKLKSKKTAFSPFALFRIQYLIVHTAIMLADGLQGETETLLFILSKKYILQFAWVLVSSSHI
jgi:hypothetical protein